MYQPVYWDVSMNKKLLAFCIALSFLGVGIHVYRTPTTSPAHQRTTIDTIYGSVEVTDPVVLDLLETNAMQRLKKINQYGIMAFLKPDQIYTRHEHSLGVFYLLRRFGASLEEQVAGLLHDISHTAFSHIADVIHGTHLNKYSYQDFIFSWYLSNTDLMYVLKKHGFERVAGFGTTVEYKMLKDDLPNLCADRLEYNLYGGYVEGWLTVAEIRDIVDCLEYTNGKWIFTSHEAAKKFAKVSIDLSVQNWSSAENAFASTMMAEVLKRGFALNIIDKDDFHFSTDQIVWDKLRASDDQELKNLFAKLDNHSACYKDGSPEKHDLYFKGKFRGVDPLVRSEGEVIQLTVLDSEFAQYLQEQKACCKEQYIAYV